MRILIATPGYPPQVGGVEQVTHSLASEYVRRGHEVAVVAPKVRGLPTQTEVDSVQVSRIPFPMPHCSPRELLEFACRFPWGDRAFRRLVAHFRPDVINSHFAATTNSLYSIRAAARHRLPLVVSLHGGDIERMPAEGTSWRIAAFQAIKRADALTACSDYLRVQAGHLAPEALTATVIRNGVAADEFRKRVSLPDEEPFFLGVGRFVHEKGFDLLLEAFCSVARLRPDIHLVLLGEGTEERALRAQAHRLGIEESVTFLPSISRRLVVEAMQTCMAVVVPSRREALGVVNLEAMAAGRPVVAAAVGGIPEVVSHGENGLLVPPEDPAALAAAMLELAASADLRKKLGAAGRRQAMTRHTWAAAASDFLACYDGAIRASQSRWEARN